MHWKERVWRLRGPIFAAVVVTGFGFWLGLLMAWISFWFAVLFWVAAKYSRSRAWGWVDPAYYLLAALGIWLFFQAGLPERKLNAALARRVEAQEGMRQVERLAPLLDEGGLLDATLDIGFSDLAQIAQEGDVCRSSFIPDGRCAAKADQALALRELVRLGSPPPTAVDPVARRSYSLSYCAALKQIPAQSKAQHVDSDIMDQLDLRMREMEGWTPPVSDPGRLARLKAGLRIFGEARRDHPVLSGTDVVHVFARDGLSATTDFAVIVLHSYSACISLPKDLSESLAGYANWSAEMARARTVLTDAENAVAKLREPQETTPFNIFLEWLRMNLWPYFLTAALALKFGKGLTVLIPSAVRSGD